MESFRKSRLVELFSRPQSSVFLARHLAITLDLHLRGGFGTHGENLLDEIQAGNDEFSGLLKFG